MGFTAKRAILRDSIPLIKNKSGDAGMNLDFGRGGCGANGEAEIGFGREKWLRRDGGDE